MSPASAARAAGSRSTSVGHVPPDVEPEAASKATKQPVSTAAHAASRRLILQVVQCRSSRANSRPVTSSGCTRASAPRCRAVTCSARPAASAAMPPNQSGWTTVALTKPAKRPEWSCLVTSGTWAALACFNVVETENASAEDTLRPTTSQCTCTPTPFRHRLTPACPGTEAPAVLTKRTASIGGQRRFATCLGDRALRALTLARA